MEACGLDVAGRVFRPAGLWCPFQFDLPTHSFENEEMLISQDAKQRVITRLKNPHNSKVITCIEPSPDVFSVLAAAASGTFSSPQGVAAALTAATSETGASIGLRTQSIQLLRDQSYRICESYANGALDELDYAQLMRRNQVMLTAVLAIEQLTGAVVGPAAAIGATSSVEVDKEAVQKASDKVGEVEKAIGTQQGVVDTKQKAVNDQNAVIASKEKAVQDQQAMVNQKQQAVGAATAELAKYPTPTTAEHIAAKKALDDANAELKAATDKLTAARTELTAEQAKIKDLEEQLTKEQGTLKGLQDQLTVAMRALNAAQAPNLSTGTASTLQGPAVVSKDIPAVARAVQNIVRMAFEKQYLLDFCQMYWGGVRSISNGNSTLLTTKCNEVLAHWFKAATDASAAATAASAMEEGQAEPGALLQSPLHMFSIPDDVGDFVR